MFLVSALLVSVVVAFFVGAGLRLATMNHRANDRDTQRALFAAESGLRYVQARQAADYNWTANDGLVVDTPEMVVREDEGNIVGIIRTEEGDFAQFRVRFNFQDGNGGGDGRPDPTALNIDSPYVSINNLRGGSSRSVPRADGAGYSVTTSSVANYEVPPVTACVIVEGRYGPGLALDAGNVNPTRQGKVTTRVVEAYLEAPPPPGGDSAAMAAGDIEFGLQGGQSVTLSAKDDDLASRLRSRANISVTGGGSPNLTSTNGETYTVDGSLSANPDSNISTGTEDTSQAFYQLSWSEVRQATSSDSTIAAGTYVIWDDGSMHYYDMSYDDYANFIQADPSNPGTVVTTLPSGMTLDTSNPSNPRLVIESNIFVDDSGASTDELTIIPRKGAQEDPPDSTDPIGDMANSVAAEMIPGGAIGTGTLTGSVAGATYYNNPPGYTHPGNIDLDVSGSFRVLLHNGHFHVLNYGASGTIQTGGDMVSMLTDPSLTVAQQAQAQQILQALGGSAASMEELELGSEPANLRADNVTLEFDPPEGESAILSAKGDVRLGTRVTGEGGSITSEGDIRLVGHGTDLAASLENGLAMYAGGDIVVSALKETSIGSNNWEYKNVGLRGVLYAWGDVDVKLSHDDPSVSGHGQFRMQGSMVAYGGDPAGLPGADGNGRMDIDANDTELRYDPVYLLLISQSQPPGPLKQILYHAY